jgi:hypothetical protein
MGNLTASPRTYNEFWTNEKFRMYVNNDTHDLVLINETTKEEIKSFICSAFNSTTFKFWDKSEITLNVGQFLKIDKLNRPIAKKFTGIQKRFVKF